MISPELKSDLLKLAEFALTSGELIEDSLIAIEEILDKYPEEVSLFVDMFEKDENSENRDVLAIIIIHHLAHPEAVEFLRNEEGWSDDDFMEVAAGNH